MDLFSPKPAFLPEERYLLIINKFFAIKILRYYFLYSEKSLPLRFGVKTDCWSLDFYFCKLVIVRLTGIYT